MNAAAAYSEIESAFPGRIVRNERLDRRSYFRIGGAADLFCETGDSGLVRRIVLKCRELNVPWELIGSGSNLLIDDGGFRGLIIRFSSTDTPTFDFPLLTAHAGLELAAMLESAADRGLSGFEFMAGIPGTVGGAVFMNAGAYGGSVADVLVSADVLDESIEPVTMTAGDLQFSYRHSVLQRRRMIVTGAVFRGVRGEPGAIRAEYARIKSIRAEKHPGPDLPCAGSYFKNLPPEREGEWRRPAGRFLEEAGAKEMRVGGAAVFNKHANMIVNTGNARSEDVRELAGKMKHAVRRKYSIDLEEEVRFLDAVQGIKRA